MASRSRAASATVRANGPEVASPSRSARSGAPETRPRVGLRPKTPHALPGIRIDPPPSLPWATGARRAATAAAAPPLEPPGVRAVSHGLRVGGAISFSVWQLDPNSGVLVL